MTTPSSIPESGSSATPPGGGRRAAERRRRRPSPLGVLGIALPALTIGALALVASPSPPAAVQPPERVALDRSDVICPSAAEGADRLSIGNVDSRSGEVQVRAGSRSTTIDVRPTGSLRRAGAASLRAEGEAAPGLVAGRFDADGGVACARPVPETWFAGLGAAPEHSSVVELVNPDRGLAVVDVDLFGPDGPVEAPSLRGITVEGGDSTRLDLAALVPTGDELAARVVVSRGRAGVFVSDVVDELGRGARMTQWLPGEQEAAERPVLAGLGTRGGKRTLVVANPGEAEVRVEPRLLTEDSEFTPADADELRVPPGAVRTLDLTDLLGARSARGARGVVLATSGPVHATLRTVADGELAHTVASPEVASRTATVLPAGGKDLLLTTTEPSAGVTWTVWDGRGRRLRQEKAEVGPGTMLRLALPARAALLDVRVDVGSVAGAVETTGAARLTWPLVELVVDALVPHVRPAHSSSR